jgi:hypothetical protein
MMLKQVADTAGGVEGCDTTLASSGESACTAAHCMQANRSEASLLMRLSHCLGTSWSSFNQHRTGQLGRQRLHSSALYAGKQTEQKMKVSRLIGGHNACRSEAVRLAGVILATASCCSAGRVSSNTTLHSS